MSAYNSVMLDDQRNMLTDYLTNVAKQSECWSCASFGSFFCVQLHPGPADLTNDIIGRTQMLLNENMLLSEQVKCMNIALMESVSYTRQLEMRINILENGIGSGSRAPVRRGSGTSLQNLTGTAKPRQRCFTFHAKHYRYI